MLTHTLGFDPNEPAPTLNALPEKPGIFALFGADPQAEPYLARTTNIRRRLKRFLDARPSQSKRLRLTEKVTRIEYTATGSAFESDLALYDASLHAFGERTRRRMHLHAPAFLKMSVKNAYPRVYVTNTVTKSAAGSLYGPFPSRATAERYCDEALNLFQLRRCHEDLHPDPAFPGCIYSEMKMCLAPCYKGCTDERYAHEAAQVQAFLATRGQSLLDQLAREREAASEALDFERAAALHARIQKVEAVAALASEAVHPLARLRAVIVQPAAEPDQVAVFLLSAGILTGPALYSTAGMRLHNEQSGSSSLYTHPYALEAVPLNDDSTNPPVTRDTLTERLHESLARLQPALAKTQTLADHLCLFARWYYRPATHRIGEIIFYPPNEAPPAKLIVRAISRVYRSAISGSAGILSNVEQEIKLTAGEL